MRTLFNIVGEFQQLYDLSTAVNIESDPEQAQLFADTLEALSGELEVKAEGYVYVINQLEMEAERCKQLEFEWEMKKKVRENSVKRLKQALLGAMQTLGKDELPAGDYKLKVVGNGGKRPLVIDDTTKVPDSLTKITVEPDKDRIRAFLESLDENDVCEFAHLEERGKHVAIR